MISVIAFEQRVFSAAGTTALNARKKIGRKRADREDVERLRASAARKRLGAIIVYIHARAHRYGVRAPYRKYQYARDAARVVIQEADSARSARSHDSRACA